MAISFDVASTGAGTSPSWSHTVASGQSALFVQVGDFKGADTESASAITFNGVALTLLGQHAFNTSRSSTWVLLNPASGIHTIAVTSGSTVACVASSWLAADNEVILYGTGVSNTGFVSTNGQPVSGSITGATSSYLIAHTGNLTDNLTEGAGQTLLGRVSSGGFHCDAAYKQGSGSSTTFSWTGYSSDDRWAVLAVEIYAVPLTPTVDLPAPNYAAIRPAFAAVTN